MGDYNVQIINARVNVPKKYASRFREEILRRLPLIDSAYHATAPFLEVDTSFDTTVSMITQTKYNKGVEEFLDWFKDYVLQGIGSNDIWSINYSEYSSVPETRSVKFGTPVLEYEPPTEIEKEEE